jgi:hypothetical protein
MKTNQNTIETASNTISQLTTRNGLIITDRDAYLLDLIDDPRMISTIREHMRDWFLAFACSFDPESSPYEMEVSSGHYKAIDEFFSYAISQAIKPSKGNVQPVINTAAAGNSANETLRVLAESNAQLRKQLGSSIEKTEKLEAKVETLKQKLEELTDKHFATNDALLKLKGLDLDEPTDTDKPTQ